MSKLLLAFGLLFLLQACGVTKSQVKRDYEEQQRTGWDVKLDPIEMNPVDTSTRYFQSLNSSTNVIVTGKLFT